MKKHLFLIGSLGSLALLFLFVGNRVMNASGDTSAVIHACVNQSSGSIKIVGEGVSCSGGELPLAWNIQGPAGPATDVFTRFQLIGGGSAIPVPNAPGFVEVSRLALPAGTYVVTANHYFTNDSTTDGIASCLLGFESPVGTPISPNAQAIDTMTPHQAVSQSLTVSAELPLDGAARLVCTNNTLSGGNLAIQTFQMNAIKVNTLIVQ